MLPLAYAAAPPPTERFFGITVMPEYIQNEGIDGVLTNLTKHARANAVTTSPYVMEPAPDEKSGSREPPIDAGAGSVRLLDRTLWGKRELLVRTAPSFEHDLRLFQGMRYQPSPASELTRTQGGIVKDFVQEARRRGLRVYLQVQAAIPPGYRVQFGGPVEADRPRLPGGRLPSRRLANNASLGSTEVRKYTAALLRDLFRAYPDIDGVRLDWPEYPPYFLDDCFLDSSEPAHIAARRLGFDPQRMERDVASLYETLHGQLTNQDLEQALPTGRDSLLAALMRRPGVLEFLRFKAALVEDYLRDMRAAIPAGKELIAHAFPPPFSLVSGLDFEGVSRVASGIAVKLYTMHWPMMLYFYCEQLLRANRGLSEQLLVRTVARWMDLDDNSDARFQSLRDCRYPEPDEPHPAGAGAQARKIAFARARGRNVFAVAHGYGPVADFRDRLEIAWKASGGRVWVNRYGYLSNAKLAAAGNVTE